MLAQQYIICFSNNNIIENMKKKSKKKSVNDSKILKIYFLPNQNIVIVNYINNKRKKSKTK